MQQRTICLSQPRKILLTQVLVRQAWQLRNRTIVQYKAPRSQYGGEKEYEDDPELYDKIWDPGQNLENSDWREFRARLVQLEHGWKQSPDEQDPHQQVISDNVNSLLQTIDHDKSVWAHLISRPEQGSLLVSRSDDLGFFNYTAILLLKHDDRVGTIGLVLNKPSPLTVRDVFTRSDVANAFGSQNVYFEGYSKDSQFLAISFNDLVNATISTMTNTCQLNLGVGVRYRRNGVSGLVRVFWVQVTPTWKDTKMVLSKNAVIGGQICLVFGTWIVPRINQMVIIIL
eukprot:TRINITY_DN37584_c0_g1_i3.p1 TRINITY_DN37584_c0_g1~~TRINITY_DN37584_c0_g1_i3.p1  ORF type:complete len:285 (-),score=5.14 TRINITY_DN37584_c0_g1_i3:123-977(-)